MRKVLVPPQSVQVKLTTVFHTWIPAFQEGVDPEAHPVKPKRTEGLKTVKAYEQLEKLRTLTSKKATFKSLRLRHMVAMGLHHKAEIHISQTGKGERAEGA